MSQPPVLFALFGVGVVLGLSGPFETLAAMPNLVIRTAYWIFVVVATFSAGAFVSTFTGRVLGRRGWVKTLVAGVAIGLVVSGLVILVNFALFGFAPVSLWVLGEVVLTVTVIALLVEIGLGLAAARQENVPDAAPALMSRLPLEKRGRLVALAVSDHYVEVVTDKGREMLLMRLSDAIRETAPVAGLQTHRSHWVALDQVSAARREGDRAVLTLKSGAEIPVSRANVAAAKAAGLFP